jgi:hypothetical protein
MAAREPGCTPNYPGWLTRVPTNNIKYLWQLVGDTRSENAYDPLSFPIREGMEGGGDGDEHMPLEIARRILRSGLRLPLPSGAVESLCCGVDGWY